MFRDPVGPTRIEAPVGWGARLFSGAAMLSLAAIVYSLGLRIFLDFGLQGLTIFFATVFLFVLMAIISIQRIEIAVLVWVISLSGFRNSLIVDLPGLPDLTPDRILLVWLVCAAALRSLARPRPSLPPYLPDFMVVAHTLYLLGSCMIANPLMFNMWTRSYLMPTAAYFFGKYLLSDLRWFQRLVYLLVAINIYMGFTAIAEHFHWNALVWPEFIVTTQHGFPNRSVGIFIQPAVLGIFLGMVLPFQFYLHVALRNAAWRWFHLAGILISLGGLYFTYTRGGWIATSLGLVAMAVLGRRIYLRRLLIYGLVTTMVLGTGLLSFKQDAFLQERIGNESTIEGRINIAATSFFMWRANPILGIGFKRFNDVAADYRETLEVPFFGLIKSQIDPNSCPHDIFVSVLAEEGLVGAAMQAAIYILIFRALVHTYLARKRTEDAIALYLLPPVGATLAVYIVGGGSFDYRFFESLNSHFYLFAGILIAWSTNHVAGTKTASVAGRSK